MKRFLIRTILLFIVPVFLGLAACEYFLRKIPNDYQYKNEWLTHNCGKIKILSLGSSHAYFGICPQYFSHSAFNAAHVSQSIKYDHFIFKKFIDNMDSLKVIILPLSYFSLPFELENGEEYWRVKDYSIYYNCMIHRFESKYNLEIYNGIHFKNVLRSIFGKVSHRECDSLGFGTSYQFANRDEQWQNSGAVAAKRHTKEAIDSTIVNRNKKLLEDIIKDCKSRNISVILLTTPTYATYRNNLNRDQLNIMLESCKSFENAYSNVHYLDLLDDCRFVEDDFYDADHLNEFGAEKLTTLLDHYIDSLQLIK